MDTRTIGIMRALGWERTADGLEFRCVTGELAAARVTVSVATPRAIRVRMTMGPLATPKTFRYVIAASARPPFPATSGDHLDPGPWSVDEAAGLVTLRTSRLVVEATLDPWQLTFRTPDGRLLTHEVRDDVNFAGHRLGPPPGF